MADSETKAPPRTNTQRSAISATRSENAKAERRDGHGRFAASGAGSRARGTTSRKPTRAELSGKGAMIAAGAAGLAVGLAANIPRKFAVQAPTMLAGDWDEALKAEHQLTLKVFDAIEATNETNTTKRAMLLTNLKHMLAKHALEEENVIYPALREAGETEAADRLNKDHGYVKQYLYELSELPRNVPAWIEKVRRFRTEIEEHMREEERELFPQLKAKLSPAKNKELTGLMNKEGLKIA